MWFFLWSSIRGRVLLVGIYSFRVLVCRDWWWILELESMYSIMARRIPIWYILELFWGNRCVFLLSDPLRVLFILLSCCLSIRRFCCSLGCHILVKKLFGFLAFGCRYVFVSSPLTCWKNFLLLFLECPVLSVLIYTISLSFSPSFFRQYFLVYFLRLCGFLIFFSYVAFFFLSQHVPAFFLCFILLACFRRFFYLRFQSNFPSRFLFFLRAF